VAESKNGRQGISLVRKGKLRIIGKRLSATRTFPSAEQSDNNFNKLLNRNKKSALPLLMTAKVIGCYLAAGTWRQATWVLAFSDFLTVTFDLNGSGGSLHNMLATYGRFIINYDVPPFVALFFGKKMAWCLLL